ncbi:hypothetical protein BDS110ZK25_83750 [Bradyrhizobium diazoefficiens]
MLGSKKPEQNCARDDGYCDHINQVSRGTDSVGAEEDGNERAFDFLPFDVCGVVL